jgi:Flp pilus assembly protein TadB
MISAVDLLAVLGALLATGGVVLGLFGIIGTDRPPRPPSKLVVRLGQWWNGPQPGRANRIRRQATLGAAAGLGALTWLASGWPIAGIIVTLAIPGVPWLIAAGSAERKALVRLEAVEAWTRRLSDIVANGTGLQAAIVATAATAPQPIAAAVRDLAAQLQAGTPTSAALRRFADALDDYTSDQVVAPLMLHAADRGDGLSHVLTDISRSIAAEIEMRATVDAKRAGPRFAVRFLTGMTVALLGFGALNPTYLQPYGTAGGQLILALLAGFYIALMVWVRRLSLPPRLPRLLARTTTPGGPS